MTNLAGPPGVETCRGDSCTAGRWSLSRPVGWPADEVIGQRLRNAAHIPGIAGAQRRAEGLVAQNGRLDDRAMPQARMAVCKASLSGTCASLHSTSAR